MSGLVRDIFLYFLSLVVHARPRVVFVHLHVRLANVEIKASVLNVLKNLLRRLDEGLLHLLTRLGARLQERQAVLVGELLRFFVRHVALSLQITLVANQKYNLQINGVNTELK